MNELIEMPSAEDVRFGLPRLPLDETLMTLLLLSEQPFIAIDGTIRGGSKPDGEPPTCVLLRVEERWSRA